MSHLLITNNYGNGIPTQSTSGLSVLDAFNPAFEWHFSSALAAACQSRPVPVVRVSSAADQGASFQRLFICTQVLPLEFPVETMASC